MAKYEIKYKEIKECMVEADTEQNAKNNFFKQHNGYDGIRRPRIWIEDIKEVVEEDATQSGGIVGGVSIFGEPVNKVDDAYMELLNLEDYK